MIGPNEDESFAFLMWGAIAVVALLVWTKVLIPLFVGAVVVLGGGTIGWILLWTPLRYFWRAWKARGGAR